MTEPRTTAGQAWLSGTRPYVRRALAQTILMIEAEAVAPYANALLAADAVLERLAALHETATWDDTTRRDLVQQAEAARRVMEPLVSPPV